MKDRDRAIQRTQRADATAPAAGVPGRRTLAMELPVQRAVGRSDA